MIFAIRQHELAISKHVLSTLPPSSSPHLSRMSQSHGFGCSTWDIKLPLAVYFTYGEKMGNVTHHWRSANQNLKEAGSFFTTAPPGVCIIAQWFIIHITLCFLTPEGHQNHLESFWNILTLEPHLPEILTSLVWCGTKHGCFLKCSPNDWRAASIEKHCKTAW